MMAQDDESTWSRRLVLAGIGIGSAGLLSQPVSAEHDEGNQKSQDENACNQPWYDWSCDVNAHENTLYNLGALSLTGQTKPITSLTGENLSIGSDGSLNANATRGFGISGDHVHLLTVTGPRDFGHHVSTQWGLIQHSYEPSPNSRWIIPFDDLGSEGIAQIHLSLGVRTGDEWDQDTTVQFRIFDTDAGEPVENSELTLTGDDGPNKSQTSSKIPYDPKEPRTLALQVRMPEDSGSEWEVMVTNLYVWGEIE